MSFWKSIFKRKQTIHRDDSEVSVPVDEDDSKEIDVISRMKNELGTAGSLGRIEGVVLDAYPGHEMACPLHGEGGVNIITGEKKHQFRITGDRIVCTACGKTAVNPSKGGREWTGVANDTNLQLIIAHRQAILKAMKK